MTIAERLSDIRLPFIHKGLSQSYLQEWSLTKARNEAELALYEAENFLGVILEEQNDYSNAENTYASALSRSTQMEYTYGIAKTANNLARLHAFLGKFDSAKEYYERAQQAYQKSGQVIGMAGSGINLALIHDLEGDYLETLNILESVEQQWQRIGITIQPWQQSLIELMRAEAYVGLEDWPAAEKSLDYVFEEEAITNQPDAMRIRGELLIGQGNYEAAFISIRQSIDLSQQEGVPYLEAYAWRALGKVYQSIDENAEATTAFEKAITLFAGLELSHEIERTKQLFTE